MKALLEKWLMFVRSYTHKARKTLEFNYDDSFLKKDIVKGLVFWKFARSVVSDYNLAAEEKRRFLIEFFQHPNKYIKIIARLECLPDVVFKKVLWRGNIDFPSFEAFLRRLQTEQEELIRKTYDELFVQQVYSHSFPTVYKKSIRDFFRFCFQITSAEKEKNSQYGASNRWLTRSAWAFNLLGLDFGFGLYSKGIANDEKIINKKFSRFLSIKNHINDFVVNQFDGKYWWFYKTARSNYVWMPKKNVKLKDHICPGFWMTLILHTIFWVVSPVLFSSVFTYWMKHGHSFRMGHLWPVLIGLVPTPLFIVCALIKFIVCFIENHGGVVGLIITNIGLAIRDWFERNPKVIVVLKSMGVILVLIILGSIFLLFTTVLTVLLWKLTVLLHLPMSTKVLLVASFLSFVAWGIIEKIKDENNDAPGWMYKMLLVSIILTVFNLYDQYIAKYFERFIVNALILIKDFFALQLPAACLLIAGIGLFFLNMKFFGLSEKYEEKFAQKTSLVRSVSILSAAIIIGLLYLSNSREATFLVGGSYFLLVMSNLVGMSVLFFVMLNLIFTIRVNEKTIEIRNASKETVKTLYRIFPCDFSEEKFKYESKLSFKRLLKNQWLLNLNEEDKVKVIKKIVKTLKSLFFEVPYGEEGIAMNKFINRNLSLIDSENFELLRRITGQIVMYRKMESRSGFFRSLSIKELNFISRMVLEGEDFSYAVRILRMKKAKNYVFAKKIKRFSKVFSTYRVKPIIWLFKKIAQPFIYCGRKAYQYFSTLKDLWKLFHERCPYVNRSKVLE